MFYLLLFYVKNHIDPAVVCYTTVCLCLCVQEGVGDTPSRDSGTLLRHAVCSSTWCFVPHRIRPKRSHLVLFRSVLLGGNRVFIAPCL